MKEKKYVIAQTGEVVDFGDVITCKKEKRTSFGTIKSIESIMVTSYNVDDLVKEGILKCVTESNNKFKDTNNIGFYISLIATQMKCSEEELIKWLDKTNEVCPKAVLDILLQSISIKLYNDDPKAFDEAECYYSLRPRDGKVGKVVNVNSYIPLFKSREDAETARNILAKQLKLMYGE